MTCGSCPTAIVWLKHARTEKPAPIEAAVTTDGNCRVDLSRGTYEVLAGAELARAQAFGEQLRRNHFMACPAAKSYRR